MIRRETNDYPDPAPELENAQSVLARARAGRGRTAAHAAAADQHVETSVTEKLGGRGGRVPILSRGGGYPLDGDGARPLAGMRDARPYRIKAY